MLPWFGNEQLGGGGGGAGAGGGGFICMFFQS